MFSLEIVIHKKQTQDINCEKAFSKPFGSPLKKK